MRADAEAVLVEALRDPKHPFRYITTLARLVEDTHPDHAQTVAMLESMDVNGPFGEHRDMWCMFSHWELRADGRRGPFVIYKVKRDLNGHAIPVRVDQ